MNRNRYSYNPYEEKPVLSSVMCLIISRDLVIEFGRALEHAASLPKTLVLSNFDWSAELEQVFEYCGMLIRGILYVPRNCYDLWMIRAMLRAIVSACLGYDFDAYYIEYNRRKAENYLYNRTMEQFSIPIDLFTRFDDGSSKVIRARLRIEDESQNT